MTQPTDEELDEMINKAAAGSIEKRHERLYGTDELSKELDEVLDSCEISSTIISVLGKKAGGQHLDTFMQSLLDIIKRRENEARIDERQLGKEDILKLRDVYLTHPDNDPDGIDPMADRAIAIRNKLRGDIVEDFDSRIAELTKQGEE